ncbi:MAG TPA: FecR domain-containing protein, partial [Puia sp.]
MTHGISKEKIKELSEKWMQGTLSEEERALFESWYNQPDQAGVPDHVSVPDQASVSEQAILQWPGDETEEELRSLIYNRISAALRAGDRPRIVRLHYWRRMSAAAVILIAGVTAWYAVRSSSPKPAVAVAHTAAHKTAEKPAEFIRHFTLPDGTQVVLRTGGRLDYPAQFAGNVREVSLSGEAYFEVAEDNSKPFIIHTGPVRTTVLGTAFNIRALPDNKEIVVSVTTGKVKVEDSRRLLAVLTSNQQVKYQAVSAAVSKDSVNAASLVTDWTKREMAFDGQSFEQVAQILGRRYGVDIVFKREVLKKCTIKAFFTGTEELGNVLRTLCTISNTSYSMADAN